MNEFFEIERFPEVLARAKKAAGVEKDKTIARLWGLEPNYLANLKRAALGKSTERKVRNLPFKRIVEWAIQNEVDVRWLFTGQETRRPGGLVEALAQEKAEYGLALVDLSDQNVVRVIAPQAFRRRTDRPRDEKVRELLQQAQEVLEADHPVLSELLAHNIRSCHQGVKGEEGQG